MGLVLPDRTRQHEAEVLGMVERFRSVMGWFNRELREIDPDLELIFAPPNAKVAGLLPGRWHVMKHIPGSHPALLPYVGPGGEYLDPDSGIFEMLRAADLWNDRVTSDQRRRAELAESASRRQQEREAEARRDELRERWQAANRTFVSMSRDTPWSQNSSGRRGARR
jgi:hypothetical protein